MFVFGHPLTTSDVDRCSAIDGIASPLAGAPGAALQLRNTSRSARGSAAPVLLAAAEPYTQKHVREQAAGPPWAWHRSTHRVGPNPKSSIEMNPQSARYLSSAASDSQLCRPVSPSSSYARSMAWTSSASTGKVMVRSLV